MNLRDLRARLARIEARVEKGDAPTFDEYWAAARRERARRLGAAYERLARVGGSPDPHPGREGRDSLLAGDTPEQAEADQQVVERWHRSQGISRDMIAQRTEQARAKLLSMRRE